MIGWRALLFDSFFVSCIDNFVNCVYLCKY